MKIHTRRARPGIATSSCCALLAGALVALMTESPRAAEAPQLDWNRDLAMKIGGSFTVASVGDIMITRPVSTSNDPGLRAVIELLRRADVTVGNFETNIRDERAFTGPLASFNGPKEIAADLRAMGFDIVGRANNHAFDSGEQGFLETNRLLEEAGIVTAGWGRDLDEARQARFCHTPHGRIGLVSIHVPQIDGRNPAHLFATRRTGPLGGRTGINPLKVSRSVAVSESDLANLKAIRASIYRERHEYVEPNDPPGSVSLLGLQFHVGAAPGANRYTIDPHDLQGNLEAIRDAKLSSHFVMVMIHAHQTHVDPDLEREVVPDFLIELAHRAIDNGADMFLAQGPHTMRGIEIYKGKPIYYNLGVLFEGLYAQLIPSDERKGKTNTEAAVERWDNYGRHMYGSRTEEVTSRRYEAVVALTRYEQGRLREIRLYPVDGRYTDAANPRYRGTIVDHGIPRFASGEMARKILTRVQQLSAPFGTEIAIEKNVGVIRIPDDQVKGGPE